MRSSFILTNRGLVPGGRRRTSLGEAAAGEDWARMTLGVTPFGKDRLITGEGAWSGDNAGLVSGGGDRVDSGIADAFPVI